MTTLSKQIALTLRQLREQDPNVKLKQFDIAIEANISLKYYNDLENGRKMPTVEVMKKIAEVYNLSLSEIFTLVEKQ